MTMGKIKHRLLYVGMWLMIMLSSSHWSRIQQTNVPAQHFCFRIPSLTVLPDPDLYITGSREPVPMTHPRQQASAINDALQDQRAILESADSSRDGEHAYHPSSFLPPHSSSLLPPPSSLFPPPFSLLPHPASLLRPPSSVLPPPSISSLLPPPSSLVTPLTQIQET